MTTLTAEQESAGIDQKSDPRLGLDVDTTQAPNIFDKALVVKVEMGSLGASKKLSATQIEVDADKDRVKASKSILDSKELQNIKSEQQAIGKALRKYCLPSPFRAGFYLVPIVSISDIDGILNQSKDKQFNELLPAFLAVYPNLVEADKISLRSTFDPNDYPAIQKVKASFYMDWSWISFGVPKDLQNVDSNIFAREQEKAAAKIAEVSDQIVQVLRSQMLDLVTHLCDRLEGGKGNGKPKNFKPSTVDNVKEFLATFQARNIVDDRELDKLCAQAKQLLDGVDPQALREQDQVRDRVKQGFEAIKAQLDTMMVVKPGRMIRFAEDEEAPVPVMPPPVQAELIEDDGVPF